MKIGVISDTHGALDARVFRLFEGVSGILHAGDVGSGEVLIDLGAIAPTTAVRGNMDCSPDFRNLPLIAQSHIGDYLVCIAHGHTQPDPRSRVKNILAGCEKLKPHALILGHSHQPCIAAYHDVLVLNPGSASRPRNGYPASVGFLTLENGALHASVVDLNGEAIQGMNGHE